MIVSEPLGGAMAPLAPPWIRQCRQDLQSNVFLGQVVLSALILSGPSLSTVRINRRNLTPNRSMHGFDLSKIAEQNGPLLVYFRHFHAVTLIFSIVVHSESCFNAT